MPIDLYPNIAKIKRGGVYQNLPGFAQDSGNADIKAMIANSEINTTAQYSHPEGSYFILNDTLYKAIINIAVNDTIAVGTNCEVAILSNDVSEIKIDVNDLETASESFGIGDYVTPEMYGAKGDGVTDDTLAIQTAFNEGSIILMRSSYLITSTLNVNSKKVIYCFGEIIYNGNSVALQVNGQNGGEYFFNHIKALNGTCVKLVADNSIAYMNNSHKFNKLQGKIGCEIFANGSGVGNQWNTLYLGWINCTEKGIWIHSDNSAFCGEWRIYSGLIYDIQQVGVTSNAIGMDVSDCSALRIFGTGFEGLGTGIIIEDSSEINIYGSRFESANQINGKTYVFKGNVGSVLISGDIYRASEIDITNLTSTQSYVIGGTIVFDGLILNAGNIPIGGKYTITPELVGFVSERKNNYETFLIFNSYFSKNIVGDIGDIAPKVIQVKNRDIILGDQYCLNGIDKLILLIQGSGYKVSDTEGTVMLTTSDAYSCYEVTAIGTGFLGQGKGKNYLKFNKFASA